MQRLMKLVGGLLLATVVLVPVLSGAEDDSPSLVGRVYHVEGSLLSYVPEENDWVAAVKDAPFGTGDTFYTGSQGHAELVVPNGTWIRIGDNTQIQFIELDSDVSEVDMAAGLARFHNNDNDLVIKATSPFGYVLVYPGGVFDFYVGENSAEIVPVKGKITFIHSSTNARYEISPGNPSILADQSQVSSGDAGVDPNWDEWNKMRESFWSSKTNVTGPSVQYLPPALRHDAYVFEENGRWEKVYYEGSNRWFWRPTRVVPGWAPFTVGRWTEWYGDQIWVPNEPFGYTTHHYGNWIFVQNRWYWAPPVTRATVGLPLLNIGFFWNPGRVSWIHYGTHVGWVPLAPRETYYSRHRWGGPHIVHITNINMTQINIRPRNYAYARHAVVVPQKNFYTVNNYRHVRVTNINNTTIINNYRAAPVINNTVIKNYSTIKQRHNFANIEVKEKPHRTTIERINTNQKIIQQGRREKGSVLQQQVKNVREGRINREAKIQEPKVTNLIVPANEVNRPKSEIRLQQREIRRAARETKKETVEPGKPSPKIGKPSAKPEEVEAKKPGTPLLKPEGVIAPTKPGRPTPRPDAIIPEQSQQPTPKPERVRPLRTRRHIENSEDVAPSKVAPKPEGITPIKPVSRPERVAPAKPAQKVESEVSEKPAPIRERLTPIKPRPKVESEAVEKPVPKRQRIVPAKVRPADKQKGDANEQEKPR